MATSPRQRGGLLIRGVLLAILAPIVSLGMVLAGPVGQASAAVVTGSVKTVTFDVGCEGGFSAYWVRENVSSAYIQLRNIYCYGTLLFPTTSPQADESNRWIHFDFKGAGCTLSTGRHYDDDGQGAFTVAEDRTTAFVAQGPGNPPLVESACVITEVCVEVFVGLYVFADNHAQGCFNVDIGSPPTTQAAESSCTHGTPSAVKASRIVRRTTNTSSSYLMREFLWTAKPAASGSLYIGVVVQEDINNDGITPDVWPATQPQGGYGGLSAIGTGPRVSDIAFSHPATPDLAVIPEFPYTVVGVQIYRASSVNSSYYVLPQTSVGGLLGTTNEANCSWYFGEQIATGPLATPYGPLDGVGPSVPDVPDVPEDPTTAPCNFDIGDPSSWLDAGMCAAVGLLGRVVTVLGQILQAVGSLAAAIVNPIVDAIGGIWDVFEDTMTALFVPSEGFMEEEFSELQTTWEATTPAQWTDALGDLGTGEVTGCQGIPLNVQIAPGVTVNEYIGGACSGTMATIAGMSRALLSALLVFGGIFACVRAVGSGFGWSPGIGRADA